MAKKPPKKRPAPKDARKGFRQASAKQRAAGETLPTREQILTFLRENESTAGKRDIARAFNVKGPARTGLKRLLADMADEGLLAGTKKSFHEKGSLPPVTVIEVTGRDDDGDLVARPAVWKDADGEPPVILLLAHTPRSATQSAAIAIGDRVLARVNRLEQPDVEGISYEAEPIRVLPRERRRQLGIFRTRKGGGGTIEPIDRRELRAWAVRPGNDEKASDGDLVRFDLSARDRRSIAEARVLESLGNPDDQRKISLIAVHAHGLPDDFPAPVIAESEALEAFTADGRTDLRDVPLITIDPTDARDHDDAVHAEPDPDPKNPGG
ncbi:MAG TPA: ribonuclease R, partial [Hyphomicrobium sp.]|nr:ribonuclease R [Hyphomicrobium sp.]